VKVVLVDYGAGNLRSVCSAFARAGVEPVVSTDPKAIREAPLAVIAGVGHVESAQRGLAANGLDEAVTERVAARRPVLGICVGMQLLFHESDEGGCGLRLLPGRVRRVVAPRVPHMGWNTLRLLGDSVLLEGLDGADMYFAHSYAVEPESETATAEVEHGGHIVAAVESGSIAGVQFHPERSGAAGAQVLRSAVDWARAW
jgi:glutamine amidotransferase